MKNEEGLRYPSIDNLLTKIDSKYKLAYASAKRAKILKEDDYTSIGISIISNIKYVHEIFTTAQTLEYLLNKVKVEKFILTIDDIGK